MMEFNTEFVGNKKGEVGTAFNIKLLYNFRVVDRSRVRPVLIFVKVAR